VARIAQPSFIVVGTPTQRERMYSYFAEKLARKETLHDFHIRYDGRKPDFAYNQGLVQLPSAHWRVESSTWRMGSVKLAGCE
jgi:hypothetical protein